ncbi:seminase-like [Eurosta solidaginis]|uniref:seminase-like n=1 Tax=Eurosta solidaginis TaxID=178769 RepID=UPI003530B5F5
MNLRIQFALPFMVLSSVLTCTNSQLRIVNGNSANIEDSPYMVSIRYFRCNHCAGSLVTEQIVVTAAHCLKGYKSIFITVVVGVTDRRETGQRRKVQKKLYPPSFNSKTLYMDIGVIKVRKPFTLSPTVNTIPLCSTPVTPGTQMRVSGWGSTSEKNWKPTYILQTTDVSIIPQLVCVDRYKITEEAMICARGDGTDTCYGDSGTGGVVNGQLCAVLTGAYGCARALYPSRYSDINNEKVQSFLIESMKP